MKIHPSSLPWDQDRRAGPAMNIHPSPLPWEQLRRAGAALNIHPSSLLWDRDRRALAPTVPLLGLRTFSRIQRNPNENKKT